MNNLKLTTKLAVVGALGLFAAGSASADTIDYSLGTPNSGISIYPGPYASVDVNRTSSTSATITFTGLTSGIYQYLMGGDGMAGVNVNASTFGVTTGSGFANLVSFGSGSEDGFGSFNLSFKNFDGNGDAVSSLVFTLTDTSGTWASAGSVLTANSGGFLAAAHIFVENTQTGANPSTGYAANGTPSISVPDGASTAMLLGISSLGVGMLKRRLAK